MGLADAITAAGRLANEYDFHLVLAGDGPLRSKLEQQAKRMGIADRVIFTGRLPDEQVALAYQAADLFLLPTKSLECFGIIIIEAYSFGCPVLASDVGAMPELVKPVSKDFIFPVGNVEALTRKITDFLRGNLVAPSSNELISYVENNYSEKILYPQWHRMIVGE
jgi:glycosyltransferase involved in cell wall biosynthesis